MEETLNNFSKLHLRALKENTYYTLIRKGINYEDFFRKAKSFKEVYDIFFNGIKFEDNYEIKLPLDDIIGFYLVNGNNFSQEDINFISILIGSSNLETLSKYITIAKTKVIAMKSIALKIGSQIQLAITTIETYIPIDYELIENNEERTFKLYIKNEINDEIEREVNESDALIIFNKLTPNIKFPVILYCNSVNKIIGNYSNLYPVDFNENKILKLILPTNSISIMNKSGEYITFDFELKTCVITVNPTKVNDDKIKRINNFIPMLKLIEENKSKRINGTVSFVVDKVIGYYSLYKYFICDKIASTLFYIDETSRSWASKDTFYVFFRDFSQEMINSGDNKTSENYFRITIPTQKKESITGFTISFTAKSKDMLPSFLYKFSRMISHFISLDIDGSNSNVSIQGAKYKIYTKSIKALSDKASDFFRREGKERGENQTVTPGDYYCRVCQAKIQPIIIEPEEKEAWIKYGKIPMSFPPPEWGFKDSMLFVCPKESTPTVILKNNKQDESGRIKALPCCSSGDKNRNISGDYVRNVNRQGTTELINSYGVIGTLNDALSTFLSISYYKDGSYIFLKQGTSFENEELTILNSSIIACIIALDLLKNMKSLKINEIISIVNHYRKLMAGLPPDVYKQELYDMTDEEIIESILDPKTYIDPYLYYRGLEIIFDIQIFVFSSDIGRENPISDEESYLPISTLELPRCKNMHIRHNNKKDIVCLYKNYGSTNKISQIPPCELILSSNKDGKLYNRKINSSNISFFTSMFNLLDKICHPYEWELNEEKKLIESCYNDPYSVIDWSTYDLSSIGKIIGQEIDIYGKTVTLIFEEWTIIIPPTQPLIILEYKEEDNKKIPVTKYIKIKAYDIDELTSKRKEISHKIYSGGTKIRPKLKSLQSVCDKFEYTSIDEDGIWLQLGEKKKAIKVLCQPKIQKHKKTINSSIELIDRKNNVSILMQIINWLWRSDWDGNEFPNFIKWWKNNTIIEDSIIYHKVPNPKINCNNIMLPIFNSFNERILWLIKIYPFFFYRNKIHISRELFDRIQNAFNIEDIYSRNLTPDDVYGEPGRFITGLYPTDSDFNNNESIILTNKEHIIDWINRNSSTVFNFRSLNNVIIIREKLTNSMKKIFIPFIYKETIGDNVGKQYLIQNSSIPSQPPELSALGIAQYYRTHKTNPSNDYKVTDDSEFIINQKYVIYKIGPSSLLEIFLDKSNGETNYLQIISYDDEEIYGALLQIL